MFKLIIGMSVMQQLFKIVYQYSNLTININLNKKHSPKLIKTYNYANKVYFKSFSLKLHFYKYIKLKSSVLYYLDCDLSNKELILFKKIKKTSPSLILNKLSLLIFNIPQIKVKLYIINFRNLIHLYVLFNKLKFMFYFEVKLFSSILRKQNLTKKIDQSYFFNYNFQLNQKELNLQKIKALKRNNSTPKTKLDVKKNIAYFFKKVNALQQNYFIYGTTKISSYRSFFSNSQKSSLKCLKTLSSNFIQHKTLKNPIAFTLRGKWFKIYYTNRLALAFLINSLNKNQKQLTKVIKSFLKWKLLNNLRYFNLSLLTVILISRFGSTNSHTNFLLNLGFVFVNGKNIRNVRYIVKSGDLIQFIFTKTYFLYWNYLINFFNIKSNRIRKYFFNLFKNRYNFFKEQKIRTPVWFLNYFYTNNDVPIYLEIDYLTLTIFCLYLPSKLNDFNHQVYKFLNLHLFRLYNWKYVT